MTKKILLINPAKEGGFAVNRLHMGFALMAEILAKDGHEVLVVDYAFLRGLGDKIKIPEVTVLIDEFRPDIIGISVFSYQYDECLRLLDKISEISQSPIILGGPHVTMFPDDFARDPRVSYIVQGEAESIISGLVRGALKKDTPELIKAGVPAPEAIPSQKLAACYGSGLLECYQIQLSRGCPFKCSFCNIQLVAGRKIRARDIDKCLEEIAQALERYPSISTVTITDDCPNFDKARFKKFLRIFADKFPGIALTVDNMRADLLDEELIALYVKAGGKNLCLGTESGDEEVFGKINKGENLEDVIKAAALVRKYNLQLGLCFVIGLPGDNPQRHLKSVALAKKLRPDYIFWNMCVPWPGTEIYAWFMENGEIDDVRNFSTLINSKLQFDMPRAWSRDFSREERVRAWLLANLETFALPILTRDAILSLPLNILRIVRLGFKYGIMFNVMKFLSSFWLFKAESLWRTKISRRMFSLSENEQK